MDSHLDPDQTKEQVKSQSESRLHAFKRFNKLSVSSMKRLPNPKVPKKSVKFQESLPKPSTDMPITTFRRAESSFPETDQIEDLYLAMHSWKNKDITYPWCLGYLTCEGSEKLGIYPKPSSTETSGRQYSVSPLRNLFSGNLSRPARLGFSPDDLNLSRVDRFELALTISYSVLQLSETPWLEKGPTKDNILLLPDNGKGFKRRASVVNDYSPTGSTEAQTHNPKSHPALYHNEALFALGILLIELCLGRPLELLRSTEDPLDNDGNASNWTDRSTAERYLDDVYKEAGNRYGDAVRRCIRCDFNQRKISLQDDDFRQAAYEGVVVPLQQIVKDFDS